MFLGVLALLTAGVGLEEVLPVRPCLAAQGQVRELMGFEQEGRMGFEVGVPKELVRMNSRVEERAVASLAGKVLQRLEPFALAAWSVDTSTSPLRVGH